MRIDYKLLISVIILSIFGCIMIYTSSNVWALYKFNDAFKYLKNQSIFLILGIFLMYFLSKLDYNFYKKKANLIIGICFILLVLVLIPGIGVIRNGSRSWFGVFGFGIQPSEATKIGLVIFISKYLSNNYSIMYNIKKGVLPILSIILIFFILIMLEPDFGTACVITLSLIAMIFISKVKLSFFIKIGLTGLLGVVILIIIAPYRMARIVSFLNPWSDPLGSGFQIIQSLYAIGPGGLFGLGLGNSIQKHFYLPEPQTDFIFSIISEELGFIGILIVSMLFMFIFYRCIKISLNTKDLFGKYLCFGLSFTIIFQTILNLCVVIGLVPVTGVTLPFLSYGGSSLLVSLTSIGIILNISKNC